MFELFLEGKEELVGSQRKGIEFRVAIDNEIRHLDLNNRDRVLVRLELDSLFGFVVNFRI